MVLPCPGCDQPRPLRLNDYLCSACRIEDPTEDFATFCAQLTLEDGSKMTLFPAQRQMLRDYSLGATETVIIIPKKNGKTTLTAALVLYKLLLNPEAECYAVAAAREQASILYRQAANFVRRSRSLRKHFILRDSTKEIRRVNKGEPTGGYFKALASDTANNDGLLADLVIVDELHRHKSPELYGLFRDSLVRKGAQMVTISTAGADELSPLGILRTNAYKLPHVKRQGAYRYARNDKSSFVLHEWAVEDDADISDMTIVAAANPAPWHTEETLSQRYESPSNPEWFFRRFACGQWVRGEGQAISPWEWDALADPAAYIPQGSEVWLGIDMSARSDHTAIVPVWWESDKRKVVADTTLLIPKDQALDWDDDIVPAVDRYFSDYNVVSVTYDPYIGGTQLASYLRKKHGVIAAEFKQKPEPLARADSRLLQAIQAGELVHDGDPQLREHALNAVEHPLDGGERFFFGRAKGQRKPTDALRALSMAHDTAVAQEGKPPRQKSGYAFL